MTGRLAMGTIGLGIGLGERQQSRVPRPAAMIMRLHRPRLRPAPRAQAAARTRRYGGRSTPASVMMARDVAAGVTSNAGLPRLAPSGATARAAARA